MGNTANTLILYSTPDSALNGTDQDLYKAISEANQVEVPEHLFGVTLLIPADFAPNTEEQINKGKGKTKVPVEDEPCL